MKQHLSNISLYRFIGILWKLRINLQSNIKETNENAQQVKGQLDIIVQGFEKQFDRVTQHTTDIENQIKQFDKRLERESQKFIEASFYYSEGSKAYRGGDN